MTHIGHLLDGASGWEQRVGVSQLLDRLPRDRYTNTPAAIDPAAVAPFRHLDRRIEVLPAFARLSAPGVARFVERRRIDLIHAWGVHAAAAGRTLLQTPLVVQLFDPVIAKCDVKLLRTMARPEGFAVVCSCEIVRRRLIEGGLAPELAVVIRPGVDFALVNQCQRGPLRETLGLTRDDFVALVPEPVTRAGGQFEAFSAVSLRHHVSSDVRIILPGDSRELRRIARFAATLPGTTALVAPGERYPFEQLVAVSDALLVTPRGDISTTSVAWAMAAGVVVIGTAVHAVAEMIANKVNGLLFKQIPGRSMTASISNLLQDRASQEKAKEAARGQAYEIFGLRRYVEQYMRLYENVLEGKTPGEGITDPAITA